MDLAESVRMAIATLKANRLRSGLTMLGIIIGNAAVIAMVGVGQGAQRYAASQFESLGPNTLFIVPGTPQARNRTFNVPQTLVLEDAKAIATQVPTVKEVAPQIQVQQRVTYRGRNTNVLIVGTTPTFPSVRSFTVAQGRFISDKDVERHRRVVILGSDLAKKLFINENPVGQQVRIKNLSFEVIGVMAEKGAFLGNNQDEAAYIPITTMSSRIVGQRSPYGISLTFISVSARDEQSIDAAKFQITNLLRLRHQIVDEDDFTIQTQKEALQIIGNISNALTLMLAAIAGISLLVGGIGIMNIMLVSVTERTQEIGLRKAIGATQRDILAQFMIEAMILSAVGGLIGTGVGVGGVMLVGMLTPLEAGVAPVAVALAVGVSGSIGLFFGVVPAQRAARLDPIVALRSV
ncbi:MULTISPECIES: ABC transporter permease [unclassified Thermosynechococcus]|uniref:ABC transporter permease n=1 Tax=unclassified Thermosynechococcus TaxID=2622553 RepID=UPI0019DF9F21|nr:MULTISPECIES: ABC transporter permease [unclassified Thermosynechococcus]HIK36238.1 ABC transporter permease [Thermosynechococcus sp. M98_K2018_005]HIK47636.1 ABC transporter permease [Thermosynechococcus sp. M55_K2018_012]